MMAQAWVEEAAGGRMAEEESETLQWRRTINYFLQGESIILHEALVS